MRKFLLLLVGAFLVSATLNAQDNWKSTYVKGQKMIVQKAAYFDVSKPLTEMQPRQDWVNIKEEGEEKEIENFFLFKILKGASNEDDPISQKFVTVATKATATVYQNFDGAYNSENDGLVAPPDTQGDVGPDHYVQAVNNVTKIYDKKGNLLWGPKNTSVFWDGFDGPWTGTNDGDPVILYDQAADRWIISQFAISTDDGTQWELVAVSTSSDPTGSYYRYAFQFEYMPDYPKLGVWPDAYYMSANAFSRTFQGTYAAAMERDKMLQGDPDARIVIFFNDWDATQTYSMLPADADALPAEGTPNYFIYDTDDATYWSSDALKIWEFHVDWSNTDNSSFTLASTLTPASFNTSFSDDVPQPGTTQELDLLNDRMMFRLQFRQFDGYQAMVVSRTVNDGGVAAVRWYELRNTGNGWSIYQQGTYNPGDGLWRWMPSIAMNANGDIAIGYSVSSSDVYPSIRVAGRFAGDELGQMTVSETKIYDGTASQTGVSRWGDYAMMSVDPSDNTTFWFTTEYSTGSWYWKTRIASFSLGEGSDVCVEPSITTQPSSVEACEGATVTFSVEASGTSLSYQWRKDGVNISGATSSTLTISDVSSSDEGDYDCVVSNDCGSAVSNKATLTLGDGTVPTITDQPDDVSAYYGSDVSFSITAEGTNLTYQWYKDGNALANDTRISGVTTSTLSINDIVYDDAGNYYCVVNSDCGSVTSSQASLEVLRVRGGRPWASTSFDKTSVYPNPFVENFVVTLSNDQLPATITIKDITGKVVYTKEVKSNIENIELKDVPANVYYIEINGATSVEHFKVIKQ